VQQPSAVGEAGGVSRPIEEKQSTNEICPPKCGPLGPSPTIPPAPQATQARGDGPHQQNQPTATKERLEAAKEVYRRGVPYILVDHGKITARKKKDLNQED
jgi:hypothetical protein